MQIGEVKVWVENIVIPTYAVGAPEKNPMFLEKRVYQGSSGVVYPYPIIEKISDTKINKTYQAVFLENYYLKVMILPELGGRVQMAYDKTMNRHFVYYNQVIKPALVGLTGPWISGGIEFNWPQHHRPSTFLPIDFTITENEDGSKTVWVNEVERLFRTKGMAGFTLYPGKAYLEIEGKLYNRTPFPQTFLWWANPAVKVNDYYQSVFPPDVHAVYDHGKRDVSSFPIAKGVYYKVDYSPGADISRYKNIPVPTSFMAVSSKYDFMGGYEHDSKGGLLHVADHRIAPGKKQWTWGNGDFGRMWDENLTDEDGPYIELMTGVYTDNQPDFSWLEPYEEKAFTQYFFPYREVGMVKNATRDAAINLEINGNKAIILLYVTSVYNKISVTLIHKEDTLFSETISSSPENPYFKEISLGKNIFVNELRLLITDLVNSKELVSYQMEKPTDSPVPLPAEKAVPPGDIENNEQLFLTGLHLEQYRHATFNPVDYYEEALKRDPKDSRCNNALGLWYLKRGRFARSEIFFKKAVETISKRNPNPYNGEAYYNLGCALKMQNKNKEAFDAFYKSTWNDAWQHAGYFNLARIAAIEKDFDKALDFINKSLCKNYHSHSVRHAKSYILRKLGRMEDAKILIEESLKIDPFNYGCLFEKYLLNTRANNNSSAQEALNHLRNISQSEANNLIESAIDYAHAGLYEDGLLLLSLFNPEAKKNTLIMYYIGWLTYQTGDKESAKEHFKKASLLQPDFVFPNKIEEILVFQKAIELNPADAKAHYYLGNFWYDKRQYKEAIQCWEYSAKIDNQFPTVHRNLSIAYFNKLDDPERALHSMENAFLLDTTDARVLLELDQLYKRLNKDHRFRLQFLNEYSPLVEQRDDLYLERVTLYNQTGDYDTSRRLLMNRKFHPWEGGEGKVGKQYVLCNLGLAKKSILEKKFDSALAFLMNTEEYPSNLGEGKLYSAQDNDISYLKGLVYEMMGKTDEAKFNFTLATKGIDEPAQAYFYNDPQPEKIFYQGLAWKKLGKPERALEVFKKLVTYGRKHIEDNIALDYFAVSLPGMSVFDADLTLQNKVHCYHLMALGSLGMGNEHFEEAKMYFGKILQLDNNHQDAIIYLRDDWNYFAN